jgi:tetratricopeptide (TPR) repeat protein
LSSEHTLLAELGRLSSPVAEGQVAGWREALHAGRVAAPHSAWLHLWLGECALASDEQPARAIGHFRQTQRLSVSRDRCYGLAAYDTAIALYSLRAYQEAAEAFHRALVAQNALCGFDRRQCALWYRQAAVCAGYHAARARLGIPEPQRLDPQCGAGSLAACLRALRFPYDKETVLRACRVTGVGSTGQDLLVACGKLGLTGRAFTADDKALKLLPKPRV